MKKIFIQIAFLFFCIGSVYSQDVNWRWLNEKNPNLVQLKIGYDFGVTTQLGYSRSVKFVKPALLTVDYSFPMGKTIFDDYKIRYGFQTELVELGNFIASVNLLGNFKKQDTELVKMYNLGIEPSILIGYYKPSWHTALEFGIIKPLTSNLNHSEIVKENYPTIQDGWYKAPGGYFNYGFQCSKTIGASFDISFRMGLTKAFGDDKDAMIPNYTQLGIRKRF